MKIVSKALLFNDKDQLLVLRRSPTHPNFPHHNDFPGGEVEEGESAAEATRREILEETGLDVEFSSLELVLDQQKEEDLQHVVFVCKPEKIDKEIVLSWEHDDYRWVDVEKVLNEPIPTNVDSYYITALSYLKKEHEITTTDAYGNKYTAKTADLTQTIRAYVVVKNGDKILVNKQWDGLSWPGGGVEKGETLEQAAVREVLEETGLTIRIGTLFYNASRFYQRDADSKPVQAFMFFFDGEYVSGEISNALITDSETTYTNGVAEWVDPASLTQEGFRHSVSLKEVLDAYNAKPYQN